MTTKKKVSKKKAAPKKAAPSKVTSRATILKFCEVTRERGHAGDTLVFGKHSLRMNKPLAKHTDAECDKVLANVKEMGLSTRIEQVKKVAATNKRKAVAVEGSKPCECGCRAITRRGSRFLPGHDAKLKSKLRNAVKKGNANAKAHAQKELKVRGW